VAVELARSDYLTKVSANFARLAAAMDEPAPVVMGETEQ